MEADGITISFDDIFGNHPEDVSMSKLEGFLDQFVSDLLKRNSHNPNHLVRIVDRGTIRWITTEEAESYLHADDHDQDAQLQKNIQQAIRGDSRILDQEIRILFLLANNTLKQYRTNQLIPESEVQRLEPTIIRLGRQVNFLLGQLREIERRMRELRIKYPILDEFERKMGMLLNLQKEGNRQAAAAIANQLATMKHTYVRLSRALKSDIDDGVRLRLNLQRQKKSILSAHRYLVAQRVGILQTETQDLRANVENLKVLLRRSDEERKSTVERSLAFKSDQLVTKEQELGVVQKEHGIIKKKEDETARVISQIEKTIAPKPEETQAPKSSQPAETPTNAEAPKDQQRMLVLERRKTQIRKN